MHKENFSPRCGNLILGILMLLAFTVNAHSGIDDPLLGCTNPMACNFDESATEDDGSCVLESAFYPDNDFDGFGNFEMEEYHCEQPVGYVDNPGDCDDTNADVFLGAAEICNQQDDDCDGELNNGVANVFYLDGDGDGFGWMDEMEMACEAPLGYVSNADDCDDANWMYADLDGDGFGSGPALDCGDVTIDGDCDDANVNFYPGATEICNQLDENCDGEVDEFVTSTFYLDADGDGFGWIDEPILACELPQGYVSNSDDCDDATWLYADLDGDGFGAGAALDCGDVTIDGDCNEGDANVFPGASEICGNDLDEDCDGLDIICANGGCTQVSACNYDELATEDDGTCFYPEADFLDCEGNCLFDTDADGICDELEVGGCLDPQACNYNELATDAGNCVYPQSEICNGFDDDCDGEEDNGVLLSFYLDADADGFGNPDQTTFACEAPIGYVDNLEDCDDNQITYNDLDSDGYGAGDAVGCGIALNSTDCDDDNSLIHPDAVELCNNLDDNCDGEVDEFVTATFFADVDGDGFGNASETIQSCELVDGYVENADDCDDSFVGYDDLDGDGYGFGESTACGNANNADDCDDNNIFLNPGMEELCNDIDDDCDIEVDEFVTSTFYADVDGDGFGNAESTVTACDQPDGFVTNLDDCNDQSITYDDVDGDGFGVGEYSACGTAENNLDCNDENNTIYPEATETCNLIDEDCDEEIDEFVTTTFYADIDGDGFGSDANAIEACEVPAGFVVNFEDCDDNALSYEDMDADGYGAGDAVACGSSSWNTDCNDNDINISPVAEDICGDGIDNDCMAGDSICQVSGCMDPSACNFNPLANVADNCIYTSTEVCDSIDNDCDGEIDEFVTTTFYADLDGDGFGQADSTIEACSLPLGFVSDNTDCNDAFAGYDDVDLDGYGVGENSACGTAANTGDCNDNDVLINPGAAEICNEVDDDCDIEVDEFVTLTYFADADGDGFGDADSTIEACSEPVGFVENSLDCDDALVGYDDLDGDGFGFGPVSACGTVVNADDCDDTSSSIAPNVQEVCNSLDDDCDGEVDNGVLVAYYADVDSDGFGDAQSVQFGCTPPSGFVSNAEDCDDNVVTYQDNDNDGYGGLGFDACGVLTNDDCNENDNSINPGVSEICGNNVDENCNGLINEDCAFDADGDGYSNLDDCDDNNAEIYPDQVEICNGIDDNCNNLIDDNLVFVIYYVDQDIDGYGTSESDTLCQAPTVGFATETGDCDDADANINPGVTEAFNGIDDNCDGVIDEDMIDTDGDGVENSLDADDDNDGLLDDVEDDFNGDGIGGDDCDNDGVPNTLDTDECPIFIPEGFSPNNDGVNEVFEIQQLPYGAVVELEVYNRWGALVYESSDYKNTWKGVNNDDEALPSGVYYYVVRIANKGFETTNPLTIWR